MIPKRVLRALSFVAGHLLIAVAGSAMAAGKPNIVLINMDNFGYGELGVYGGGITRGGATFLRYCNGVMPPLRRKKA